MIRRLLTFVRFSHTLFALPFALGSMLVAAPGWPGARLCVLIVLAMVFARTAAMTFNRLADWEIDKRNPRTAARHELIPFPIAIDLLVISFGAFIATTYQINTLCFALSPVALAIIFFYSLTKRFTDLSHFFLGLALAVSPIGAWLAVRGHFDLPPLILAVSVLCWVAGFDLIYATQDAAFDRLEGLRSMVVRLGTARAMTLAHSLHAAMWILLLFFGIAAQLGIIYFAAMPLIFGALIYEHRVARRHDADAIQRAFFYSNAFVGFIFLGAIVVEKIR